MSALGRERTFSRHLAIFWEVSPKVSNYLKTASRRGHQAAWLLVVLLPELRDITKVWLIMANADYELALFLGLMHDRHEQAHRDAYPPIVFSEPPVFADWAAEVQQEHALLKWQVCLSNSEVVRSSMKPEQREWH